MTIKSSNPFSLLSEDVLEEVIVKKEPDSKASKPEPKKITTKSAGSKPTPAPTQEKESKKASANEKKPTTKSGRGGLPSFPRQARTEPSDANFVASDHIKEEARPSRAQTGAHREAPAHGRKFDRHSGTGRVDREKKEVAGHSWGKPVDIPEGVSAQEALEISESDKLDTTSSKPAPTEETPAAPAVETSQSFSDYLNEQKKKKAALNLSKPEPRKANEGIFDNEQASLKVLNKSSIKDNDSLAGLLKGSPKSSNKKNKKEKEKKETIAIEPRFSLDRSQRPARGGARGNFGGSRGNFGGSRPQFNKRATSPSS